MTGRMLLRPGTTLAVVVTVLAAGLGVATATRPDHAPPGQGAQPAARSVPVARAVAACPDPVTDADAVTDPAAEPGTDAGPAAGSFPVTTTLVTLAAPGAPGPAAGATAGLAQAELSTLDGTVLTEAAGTSATVLAAEAPAESGPVVARAFGAAAPGLVAGQLTRSTTTEMRGLAGTQCAPSAVDAWFVGSGAVIGQRGRVYLTNTEAAPAVVDLRLYGPDGPIDAPDARGIAIAPGEQEVRLLDALAPDVARFAVHVHARQGRVSAAVRDQQVDGLTPLGADWVPATTAPARRTVVAGVPAGAGPRLLQVVAPGDGDAIVRLRLLTPAGPTAPDALDVLEVRAGTVAEVDLSAHTGSEPVGVELTSDVPVTAGVLARVSGATGQLGEIAYAAGAGLLTPATPGTVSEARQGAGATSRLLVSAPEGDATVLIAPVPPATGQAIRVSVGAGGTVPVDLADVSPAASFAITVTPVPGSAPVVAARQVDEAETRGPFVTSSPVEPGRYVVQVPRAVADLSTGLRLR